jgi:ribulose 1,5-bisphosphate synthetase/thiazole synthase
VIFQYSFDGVFKMFLGQYDYDLVVIGGGSGGLSCAKEGFYSIFYTLKILYYAF